MLQNSSSNEAKFKAQLTNLQEQKETLQRQCRNASGITRKELRQEIEEIGKKIKKLKQEMITTPVVKIHASSFIPGRQNQQFATVGSRSF